MTPKVVRDLEYPGFKGKVNLFCKTEGEEFGERGRALQLRGKAEREGMVEDFLVCKGILPNTHKMLGEGMCYKNLKGWSFTPRLTCKCQLTWQIEVATRQTQEGDHKSVRPGN